MSSDPIWPQGQSGTHRSGAMLTHTALIQNKNGLTIIGGNHRSGAMLTHTIERYDQLYTAPCVRTSTPACCTCGGQADALYDGRIYCGNCAADMLEEANNGL